VLAIVSSIVPVYEFVVVVPDVPFEVEFVAVLFVS
jgi:hypothetical protein